LSEYPAHGIYERKYSDEELFALLGILNSMPFDFLIGEKTDKRIATYSMLESQVPRYNPENEYLSVISQNAARLNCYGDEFEEMRERLGGIEPTTSESERREIQAEIDAAAFHAYGLDQEETEFVLDDFHRVENPRVMDDEYFETVKRKYEALD
jgi:hypothetical protein